GAQALRLHHADLAVGIEEHESAGEAEAGHRRAIFHGGQGRTLELAQLTEERDLEDLAGAYHAAPGIILPLLEQDVGEDLTLVVARLAVMVGQLRTELRRLTHAAADPATEAELLRDFGAGRAVACCVEHLPTGRGDRAPLEAEVELREAVAVLVAERAQPVLH